MRLKNIYAKLNENNLDGLILSSDANISYLTETPSRDSYLLVTKKENLYFTDSRYTAEAKISLKGKCVVKKINGSGFKLIADACSILKLRRVGFEERHLPFAEYKKIKEFLAKHVDLAPTHSLVEDLRKIKEAAEVKLIKQATRITIAALRYAQNCLKAGKKEIEVVGDLERFIRYEGGSNCAFDTIVASGPNSAYPHHIPAERKLRNNEAVLIDIGTEYQGYKSDLTRVFFLGKISVLARRVYDIVAQAQKRAIQEISPDKKISKIDACARQYITQKGYGACFGHSLGHGIGLEVHEEPHISPKESGLLKPGMAFTVEPAVYLPGKFGIRLEDAVLVTEKGCEVLSGALHK